MDSYEASVAILQNMTQEEQLEIVTLADHFYGDRLKRTRSRHLLQDASYHHSQKSFALREAIAFHREREQTMRRMRDYAEEEGRK